MEDQIGNMRIATLEARMATLEQRLAQLEQGGSSPVVKQRKHKDLSPEQRVAIRARLVAGKEAKKQREIAEAAAKTAETKTAETKAGKPAKKKEAKNGTSEAAN